MSPSLPRDFSEGDRLDREAVIGVDCDILIPAARPDAIRADNQDTIQPKLIVQGANIGITAEAEASLHDRGVLCVPDFIANAGGVICAAVEHRGGTQAEALEVIDESIRANTAEVLADADREGLLPRQAQSATTLAKKRVLKAMRFGRWD